MKYYEMSEDELRKIIKEDLSNIEAKSALLMKTAKAKLDELGMDFVYDETRMHEYMESYNGKEDEA